MVRYSCRAAAVVEKIARAEPKAEVRCIADHCISEPCVAHTHTGRVCPSGCQACPSGGREASPSTCVTCVWCSTVQSSCCRHQHQRPLLLRRWSERHRSLCMCPSPSRCHPRLLRACRPRRSCRYVQCMCLRAHSSVVWQKAATPPVARKLTDADVLSAIGDGQHLRLCGAV